MSRIHFLVDGEDKLRWEGQASREGMSLGAWLREAAEARYRAAQFDAPFESAEDVRGFFDHVDRTLDRRLPEPDWEEHRRVLDASRRSGLDPT